MHLSSFQNFLPIRPRLGSGESIEKKKNPISSINSGCILIIPLNMVFGIHYYSIISNVFDGPCLIKKHLKTPFFFLSQHVSHF